VHLAVALGDYGRLSLGKITRGIFTSYGYAASKDDCKIEKIVYIGQMMLWPQNVFSYDFFAEIASFIVFSTSRCKCDIREGLPRSIIYSLQNPQILRYNMGRDCLKPRSPALRSNKRKAST
jgi:hypothetical protein